MCLSTSLLLGCVVNSATESISTAAPDGTLLQTCSHNHNACSMLAHSLCAVIFLNEQPSRPCQTRVQRVGTENRCWHWNGSTAIQHTISFVQSMMGRKRANWLVLFICFFGFIVGRRYIERRVKLEQKSIRQFSAAPAKSFDFFGQPA